MAMTVLLQILAAISLFVALNYGVPVFIKWLNARELNRRVTESRTIILTYDDGPGRVITPQLLQLLDSFGAKASFFPIGSKVGDLGDLLDQTASNGHEIGCHSRNHLHDWKSLPYTSTFDAKRGYECLERWVPSNGLFRPPYGKFNLATWVWLRLQGARLSWWTIDAGDTWNKLPDIEEVTGRIRDVGGAVVLLHDFQGTEARTRYVLDVTRAILEMAAAEGFNISTAGQWLRG